MEFVGNRLWVARDRQLFASDIFNPLNFTENIYLSGGGSFQAIDGDFITGLKRTSDAKQLLVFTAGNTTAIQAGNTDRSSWQTSQNFVSLLFPGVGCVAGKSPTYASGELYWYSIEGVRRFNAVGDAVRTSKNPIASAEEKRSYDNLSPITSRVCGLAFNRYVGFSVPSGDILNRHTWVLDVGSSDTLIDQLPPVWQGVWTGTRPVEWTSGFVNGVKRSFYLSQDLDRPRIWEAFIPTKLDNGYPITCGFESAGDNFNQPLSFKKFKYTEAHLKDLLGEVPFTIEYKSDYGCWHEIASVTLCSTACQETLPCTGVTDFNAQARYIVSQESITQCNEGGSPFSSNISLSFQQRFRWRGRLTVRAYRITADEYQERSTGLCSAGDDECISLQCCDPEQEYVSIADDIPCNYYYSYYGSNDVALSL
jgi:hypothetical protein